MTTAIGQAQAPRARGSVASEFFKREPLLAGTTLMLAVLLAPLLVAHSLDARLLQGVNVWVKPIKFAVALVVYLGTLAWFAGWLPAGTTEKRWYRLFVRVVVASVVAEMVWIVGAAAAGTASHFNSSVPLLMLIYPVMGVLAIILTSASVVYGVVIWRDASSRLNPAFRLSVAIGLVMTFVTTVIAASVLASGTSHFVGGAGTDAGGMALMGWSRTGGDLRVAHFFATHALHALPLIGLLLSPWGQSGWARSVVILGAVGYVLLIGYALATALMGQPFLAGIALGSAG